MIGRVAAAGDATLLRSPPAIHRASAAWARTDTGWLAGRVPTLGCDPPADHSTAAMLASKVHPLRPPAARWCCHICCYPEAIPKRDPAHHAQLTPSLGSSEDGVFEHVRNAPVRGWQSLQHRRLAESVRGIGARRDSHVWGRDHAKNK